MNVHLSREVIDGGPALTVSWVAPSSDQDIKQYEVKYRRIGHGTAWDFVNITGSPLATTTNLSKLDSGRAYRVAVRAWSEAGPGQWSYLAVFSTYGGEFTHGVCIHTYIA